MTSFDRLQPFKQVSLHSSDHLRRFFRVPRLQKELAPSDFNARKPAVMSSHVPFLRICSTTLLAAFVVTASGCIHWPGEPYVDAVATPTEPVRALVTAQFPDAEFTGPVYRWHTDTRQGYQIASQVFLFNDGSGKANRGNIDTASRLTAHPVTFVSKLPGHLHATFFDGPSAMVPGGRIDGNAWVFADPDPVYEFRFASAGGSGFGRISESKNSKSAYPLR